MPNCSLATGVVPISPAIVSAVPGKPVAAARQEWFNENTEVASLYCRCPKPIHHAAKAAHAMTEEDYALALDLVDVMTCVHDEEIAPARAIYQVMEGHKIATFHSSVTGDQNS